MNYGWKGTLNENSNSDCAASTWAKLPCVWAKWISQFPQHGPSALRIGGTICWRTRTVSLLLGSRCATNRRRCAIACESVRGPRSCAAWTSHCEHNSVSPVTESEWGGPGNCCGNPLVDCLLCTSPILLRDICATDVIRRGSFVS